MNIFQRNFATHMLATAFIAGSILFAAHGQSSKRVDLGKITKSMLGSTVQIEADVDNIREPREGTRAPWRIDVSDATGSQLLIIWQNDYEKLPAAIRRGDRISATVKVGEYRDQLQLQLVNVGSLRVLGKAAARPAEAPTLAPRELPTSQKETTIADITDAMVNQRVVITAKIANVREPWNERAPYTVTLEQDGWSLPLVLWSDTFNTFGQMLKVGNVVRVNATVSQHRDQLQLRLDRGRSVALVSEGAEEPPAPAPARRAPAPEPETTYAEPAPSPAPQAEVAAAPAFGTPQFFNIGDIGRPTVNQQVIVSGKINSVGDDGKRLEVADSSGKIVVFLPSGVASALATKATVKPDAVIAVTGTVQEERGTLQIVPRSADDVHIIAP
jgi:DNA/RNA endonuclease YhcR with UshA esterase domain